MVERNSVSEQSDILKAAWRSHILGDSQGHPDGLPEPTCQQCVHFGQGSSRLLRIMESQE